MKTESLERALKTHPALSDLSPSHVAFLTGCAKNLRCASGELLFREGDAADHVVLLREGKVALEIHTPDRGPLTVESLHAGDVMGWSVIFPPYRWHVDARAVKAVVAFAIDGACLRAKLDADPAFGYAFTRLMLWHLHRRLERSRLQALDVFRAGP